LISENMRVTLVVMGAFLAFLLAAAIWRKVEDETLVKADEIELGATYDRWVEAGRPEGERLAEFMKGRRSDLIIVSRSFIIEGTNFGTQFGLMQPKSRRIGTLYVTTNRVFISMDALDHPTILSHN
jgi:hypothetical protein